MECYLQAADAEYKDAMDSLGQMYESSEGVTKD